MKKLILFSILALLVSRSYADDYYWVGGAGSWSDLNHWASTSGGVANKSIVPGTGDDVYFDANSGLVANSLVTMPTTGHAYCRNMSWAGVTTAAQFRNISSYQLHVYGNLELSGTVRYAIMTINFTGSGNATYRTNGAVRIPVVGLYNSFIVNKPGGSVTLLDGIDVGLSVQNLVLTAGTLDMSGQTHTIANFTGNGSTVRSLNISNSTITVNQTWNTLGSNMTLNAAGSSLTSDMFHSAGLTYAKVFPGRNNPDMDISGNTFEELTFTSAVANTGTLRLGANNTIGRLEFKGGGRIAGAGNVIGELILAPEKGYIFHGNNTINTLMRANTPDCDALGELRGADANAILTFGAGATADIRNVLITSLTVAGSIAPITAVGVDGGSNTGWNIVPRTSGNATLYWVGGAGEWNDKAHWSFTSGGPGGACVPFTTDDVVFDANSGFTSTSKTVSLTNTSWCHDMTWTNVANSPILATSGYPLEIWGSVTLDPTLTLQAVHSTYIRDIISMKGTEASTFAFNGCNLGNPLFNVEKTGVNGGITITDDVAFPACSLRLASGHLLMPGRTINIAEIRSQTTTVRTIDISNATITVNDWAMDVRNATSVNNAAGSFITAKVYFIANGFTYPKVYSNAFQNTVNITGTTIGELVFTNTSLTTDVTALSGNGNNTVGTLDVRGGGVDFRGTNTINNLLLAPSRTYYFRGTQTITGLFRFNSPDCNGLGELRDLDGTPAILNFGPSSTQDFNNVYLLNMTATGSGVPISISGADAGGNTGFNMTPSAAGPRYWVGGSGDWNESAHWSTTSGGPGGACVPTVTNDVFFNAASFTAGSSAVTISQGNAYCRNMDWTGAANAPTFTKTATLTLEIWGNLVMNPGVNSDAEVTFTGPANATLTPNNANLGPFNIKIAKPAGSSLTFLADYNNSNSIIKLTSGGLNLSGRSIVAELISDDNTTNPTSVDIRNANISGKWQFTGGNKTLQADGSHITGTLFRAVGGTYNSVDVTTASILNVGIRETTIGDIVFSNASNTSQVYIAASNTIRRLEFKGKGTISGTGNTIDTLIFAPGKTYTFLSGSNTTITKEWFGSGTPCNLTEITSSAAGVFTVTKTAGDVEFDYVRLRNITAAGITPFKALEHSEDLGGNTNWDITPYNGSTPILGLGPDLTLCANEFPHTLNTNGFFASPLASFSWNDGSTGKTLVASGPGTYSVTVSYPDGCTRADEIIITRSDVIIDPITGTDNVCEGNTTTLATITPGGTWSTSDAAIATVNATGVVTGVTPGTATITYTLTNGDGCTGTQTLAVTVNALPVVPAITGTSDLFEGATTTLSNTTPGGVWSSSNTAVATVSGTGVVTGVSGGSADITYTVTNANGCTSSQTVTVTVDGFSPAKRVLAVTKTADAAEPSTNGGFSIHLPTGAVAAEDITITYTIGGTATAPSDYTALSGTAVIIAGENGVTILVTVQNDALIESAETVIVTLSAGNSTNYTYTINGTAGNATVQIADDDDTPANRVVSVTAQLNASEPTNTGTFTVSLPNSTLAPEDITITFTLGGTATNGVDYETFPVSIVIPAGQNKVVIDVTAIDDLIMEKTETIELTLTGATTPAAGSFTISTTQGTAVLSQNDNDYTTATRLLSVTSNGDASEPGTNSSFTISLPTGYTSYLPVTVTYTITGTATNGVDYNGPSTTAIIPAGETSVTVPVNVDDDNAIEPVETVILSITNGIANEGGTTVFTLSPDPAAATATVNINDDENTGANLTLSVSAQNAAEPATPGSFTISLPPTILAAENITVSYTMSGTATAGSDYTAITASVIIPSGENSVEVPLNVIDDNIIENTETVVFSLTGGTSASFIYTVSTTNGSASANITDNDFDINSQVVLLTKVSDAIEGGTNGQYRIAFPPGVTSSEDVTVQFTLSGTAKETLPEDDYNLSGLSAGNIVILAGTNEVFIDVTAADDGVVEGPEDVILTLDIASSPSHSYTIDPSGNGATVNIIDVNAASTTRLQLIAGTNAAEPSANGTFTIKLEGTGTLSAWPVTIGYALSGTAVSGEDYQSLGTIVFPANTNSMIVNLNVIDDKIIETTETMTFTLLSGSATDGSNAYIFPADPASNEVTVSIADDDNDDANRILKVTPATDGAEPGTNGAFTISLPDDYTAATDITLSYNMSGTAILNTDYEVSVITLPANRNSVTIPVTVQNDLIIEETETVILTLTGATDDNSFTYTVDPAGEQATVNIADDDNVAANRMLRITATTDAAEPGTDGNVHISLPAGVTASVPVTVSYTIGGTATSDDDYDALSGTAIILVGENGVDVPVIVNDDQVIEQTETVTLTITGGIGGDNYTPAAGSETASVDITDNDNTPVNTALSITPGADVTEGAAAPIAFTIGLPGTITASEDITVTYTIGGTAEAGTDYTAFSGSAVIPAGETSITINAPVQNDLLLEPTETVTLTLTGGSSASFAFTGTASATVNILDDENTPANLALSITKTADAAEPGTNGNFRISLPGGILTSEDVTVTYTIAGIATPGADYTALTGSVIIPAGQNSVNVPVAVMNDALIENSETVIVTLSGGTSASFTFTGTGSETVNIADDDSSTPANKVLTITKGADGTEPGTDGSFTISLPAGIVAPENITVNYTVDGTATPGTDYVALSGSAVIPAGQNSVSVPVTVSDDQLIELTETVRATLIGGASASFTFTGSGNATVNIADDESALPANLTLNITKGADGAEPGTNGSFTISLNPTISASEDVTVNYTVSGTATGDDDYTALTGTIVIPHGQNSVSVPVTVADDDIIESTETVIATLTGGSSANFTFTGTAAATVDITDNDNTPANRTLSITKLNDAAEPASAGRVRIALPADITATEDITVTYTIAGSATADADYAALTGTALIPAGQNSVMVPVSVIDDQVIEPLETVALTLAGGSSTSFAFTGTGNVTVDISDDDSAPANLVLNITSTTPAAEPGTAGSFTISLPDGITATEDITVTYAISGTATGDEDYSPLAGLVVIPAGDNSVDVPVSVLDDDLIEGVETVTLEITDGSSPSLNFVPGTDKTASIDIADDDLDPSRLVLNIAKNMDGAEPGTNGSFSISLPDGVQSVEDITVTYTVSGTATAGEDYTALTGTAVIAAGEQRVTIPVTVTDDQVIEPLETVIVTLTGGNSTSFAFTGTGNATVNITDNESVTPADMTLAVTKGSDAAEPATNGSFIISLPDDITASEDITVNYTVSGTASGPDYTALSGTVVIPAGARSVNIPVTVTDDKIIEGTETVIVTLTDGASTSFTFTATGNATVEIADDDNIPANVELSISKTGDAAEPSTNGSFSISLPEDISVVHPVTVTYTISGTATAGTDYTMLTGTAIIPAGDRSVTVPVAVTDDEIIEGDETVIVTLTGGSSPDVTYTAGAAGSATVTIADDDNSDLRLEITANLPNAAEPATDGEFTISIAGSKRTAEPVTIQYIIGGSATPDADYEAIAGTITIPAGGNSVTVPVRVIDDIFAEDPETVSLTITGGQSTSFTWGTGTASQAEVTITSEDAAAGDLMITKEIVQPLTGPYRLGQEITYRITVRNVGSGLASGVTVKDTLPVQLALPTSTTAQRGQVDVAEANKLVLWTIGDVLPGDAVQLEIRCRITEGGELVAEADVTSGSADPDLTNNKAEMRLQIEGLDLSFPNVFTPNGDGKNERFVIGGLEKYPGSKLQVFNRWGGQVYRSNDYRNDWNGSDLTESTYYYILEVRKPDGVKVYKGWVFITR